MWPPTFIPSRNERPLIFKCFGKKKNLKECPGSWMVFTWFQKIKYNILSFVKKRLVYRLVIFYNTVMVGCFLKKCDKQRQLQRSKLICGEMWEVQCCALVTPRCQLRLTNAAAVTFTLDHVHCFPCRGMLMPKVSLKLFIHHLLTKDLLTDHTVQLTITNASQRYKMLAVISFAQKHVWILGQCWKSFIHWIC